LARERQSIKEQEKQEDLDRLKGLEILVEAAPNAMLLLSDHISILGAFAMQVAV